MGSGERGRTDRFSLLRLRFVGTASLKEHPASAVKAFGPVGRTQVLDADFAAWFGRVNKFAIANIDAHMAKGAAHGVEEHQVPGLELGFVDFFGRCSLFRGPAREQ